MNNREVESQTFSKGTNLTMALTTIHIQPDFVSNQLISEQPNPAALARIAAPTPMELKGMEPQIVNFDGEMQIFADDFPDASENETTKKSNTASNTTMRIYPIVFQYSQRFSKRFLTMYGTDAYSNHGEAATFTAGMPTSVMTQLLTNPYQQTILNQFRASVNAAAGRALDYAGIFGVNPYDMAASKVARNNEYLLQNAQPINWKQPAGPTPGDTAASAVLRKTVRDLGSKQADYQLQGVMTGDYMGALGDETTTIGSAGTYSAGMPLISTQANVAGIPFAVAPTLANEAGAKAAGRFTDDNPQVIDAIVGAFRNRFIYGVIPLGNGIEVFDTGNPDGGQYDLAQVNQVLLRVEVALGWGFLGGTDKFRMITHDAPKA